MGCVVVANDNNLLLRVGDQTLQLSSEDIPEAVERARGWLGELEARAGEQGEALARRRRVLGFSDFEAFCNFTALDETQVFEAEAGLITPNPVHLRILDWLESGRLRP